MRQAQHKLRYDAADSSPTVCRCEGRPRPLEPAGPHCVDCRRMFSAGLRLHLARRARRRRLVKSGAVQRWIEELAAQLRLSRTGV